MRNAGSHVCAASIAFQSRHCFQTVGPLGHSPKVNCHVSTHGRFAVVPVCTVQTRKRKRNERPDTKTKRTAAGPWPHARASAQGAHKDNHAVGAASGSTALDPWWLPGLTPRVLTPAHRPAPHSDQSSHAVCVRRDHTARSSVTQCAEDRNHFLSACGILTTERYPGTVETTLPRI